MRYRNMDLEAARKTLSKRNDFSPKRIAFFVVAGLALAGGILLRSGQYFAQPDVQQNAPVAVHRPRRLWPQRPPPLRKRSRLRRPRLHNPRRQPPRRPARERASPARPSTPPAEKAVAAPSAQTSGRRSGQRARWRCGRACRAPAPRRWHHSRRQAARRSADRSVRLGACFVRTSGRPALPRGWSRGGLCPHPGLEE